MLECVLYITNTYYIYVTVILMASLYSSRLIFFWRGGNLRRELFLSKFLKEKLQLLNKSILHPSFTEIIKEVFKKLLF